MKSRGVTLVELMIAMVIGIVLFYGIYLLVSSFQKSSARLRAREPVVSEVNQMLADIQMNFLNRMVPAAGEPVNYEAMASTAFKVTGADDCMGFLIRQRNTSTTPETIRKVEYEVICVENPEAVPAGVPVVHPQIVCTPTERAVFKRTVWPDESKVDEKVVTVYPVGPPTFSVAVCIKPFATEVLMESGALYKAGVEIHQVLIKRALPVQDKSGSLEYVPVLPKKE